MRGSRVRVLLPVLFLAGAVPAPGDARQDELLLVNARVFTADPLRPWAEALAVRDGRVVAVGTDAELRARPDGARRVIDAGGRLVVPGFNDAHAHVSPPTPGVTLAFDGQDPSLATVADSLAAAVGRVPTDRWITGWIGPAVLEHPERARRMLDSIAPSHAVQLAGFTGHGAVINAAGLARLGLDESALGERPGGWWDRSADGRLAVRAFGYAWSDIRGRHVAQLPDSAVRAAIVAAGREAAAFGITTIQVMAMPLEADRFVRLAREIDLPVRMRVIRFGDPAAPGAPLPPDARPGPMLTVSGVKWITDGTPVERLALRREPYADRPDWYGRGYMTPAGIADALRAARRADTQPMLHVAGDSAASVFFRALREAAPDSTWRRLRPRIEHGDFVQLDQLEEARRLGVVVVQNPSHLMLPELIARRVGAARPRLELLRSYRRAGVVLAFGSDGPVNPFLNVMFATMNLSNPAEALPLDEAIVAYTRGSAYAEGRDDKGMLAPGMLADFAVLSQDVFEVPPRAWPATTSVLTVVGGRIVHEAPD